LFHKLQHTKKRFTIWSCSLFSNAKVFHHATLLVILQLDIAQESRILSPLEMGLTIRLKRKVIALVVIERTRKKQCSHISNIKKGDANTNFFHLKVNTRRRKTHIHGIKRNNGQVTDHEQNRKDHQ
jgi:hypothetical protein